MAGMEKAFTLSDVCLLFFDMRGENNGAGAYGLLVEGDGIRVERIFPL